MIAIASIFQESNGFAGIKCELADFEALTLLESDDIRALAGSSSEVGGALRTLSRAGGRIVPTLVARAAPGGVLAAECWRELRDRVLNRLRRAGPVQGVILAMHGSMVAEGTDDPEGELLELVRELTGPDVPVVATLDMHANITARMLRHATALIPYHCYPHDDTFEIGCRAADLVLRIAAGEPAPGMSFVRLPMLTPAAKAQTIGDGPMAWLTRLAREARELFGLEDVAVVHVHPHNDLPEMGNGVLTLGGNEAERHAAMTKVAQAYWDCRFELEADLFSVADAVGAADDGRTAVIADWSDCVGGGAAGDSVWPLRGLMELDLGGEAHVCVVDPEAAAACLAAGAGATVELTVGHRLDPAWGAPVAVRGVVEATRPDATFRYAGGLYGGALGRMGDSAVIRIGPWIRLLITSLRTYEWRGEQYAAMGFDPARARYIVVKNPMNFRPTYKQWTELFVPVSLPGATTPALRQLTYRRLPRPCFPLELRSNSDPAPLTFLSAASVESGEHG
ncbi:M81 family metallopeptidase [Actinomadura sp. B10D3]|uniref:M81 family metallopeptidase n=1 Tax=Actinomadura sp. B10D3 TaxID=3153557 RepID=UPI00325CC014